MNRYIFSRKLSALSLALCISIFLSAQELSYYLPPDVSYDSDIPTPEKIIGHQVGEWHVTHDRLVQYMRAVEQASPRIILEETGVTYEGRPQLLLTITSPANHAKLEQLRSQHIRLSDPSLSASLITTGMPVVVWIGCSIHGNEPSGANASMLAAYYLAAAKGNLIDSLLENTIILLDPSFNPDGLNRFASWVNTHKSVSGVTDPNSREFNETWPGGRTNHYWFDLNRDWLPAQHPESRNRLKVYHRWKPNILTDHHEMGTNASFFFQPGVPSRVNSNTPLKNQELTGKIAGYHARYLDKIGSFYFTKEGYDDFYYGKGSTYPDVNGSIGILFEQASSRGHAQESSNGILTFPFTIRNQFTTMLSTLEAARNMRKELLDYQREFYINAVKESNAYPVKAWVFGDPDDKYKTDQLVSMLLRHEIDLYSLKTPVTAGGNTYTSGNTYIIPAGQKQFKLIKSIFEKVNTFADSLFYDISAWTLPAAFGLPYAELNTWNPSLAGEKISSVKSFQQSVTRSDYAYVIDWNPYDAPALLYRLQSEGLLTKSATSVFEAVTHEGLKRFGYGSILIPVHLQSKKAEEVFNIISSASKGISAKVYAIPSGMSVKGVDLGSSAFIPLKKPSMMIFAGTGTSPGDVGEIWHLMDQRYGIPASLVDVESFSRIDPDRYNVIIMPGGSYSTLSKASQEKLKIWVQLGGTLIGIEDAVQFLATNGFSKVIFRKDSSRQDTVSVLPYYLRNDARRARDMPGSIFEADLELSHPLCYGYRNSRLPVFKSNDLFMDKNNSPYSSPVRLTDKPLQSGYFHKRFIPMAPGSAVINIDGSGRGRIISMTESPNFRAFWFGTNRLLMNAIFFGNIIDAR